MANTKGRILFVFDTYQKNQFSSLRAAIYRYNILLTTLTRRLKEIPFRPDSRPTNLKLTQIEEIILF